MKVNKDTFIRGLEDGSITWSKVHPNNIRADISGKMLNGKFDLLYGKIATIVKSYGKVMKENSGAIIIQISDERGWVVTHIRRDLYVDERISIEIYNNRNYQDIPIEGCAKDGETTREYIKPQRVEPIDNIVEVDTIAEVYY